MLHVQPPVYKFCPMCGIALVPKNEYEQQRLSCPNCYWTYYPHVFGAAGAVIISPSKQLLLVKRKREPYKNKWVFPAGFIEYGEHPEETLVREVKEETGLNVKSFSFLKILQNPDDPRAEGHFGFFYLINGYDGSLTNEDRENTEIDWFSLDNLPELGWQTHKAILEIVKKLL